METRLVIQPLGSEHDRAAFSCDVEELDRYIRERASQDTRRSVAAVFVGCLPDLPRTIIGYYSLSSFSIVTQDLPLEMTKKLPRYPVLPAVLLGRLAIDQCYKGQRFGSFLLMSALRRSLEGSKQIAAMAVVVDAPDEAATTFYEHHDFQRFPGNPHRLYIPMSTVAKLFGQ